jgi:hypothetical protein
LLLVTDSHKINNNNYNMKNQFKSIVIGFFLFSGIVNAQVVIGTPNPDASAILDLTSMNKGFLVPRMDTANRNAIVLPALGLIVFNTTSNKLEINNGNLIPNWVAFSAVGTTGSQGVKGPDGLRGATGQTYSLSGVLGSVVGGGTTNVACGLYSTVIGGSTNTACGINSLIGGGTTNVAPGLNASVSGGTTNSSTAENAFVGGGSTNSASALNSSVSGGTTNQATGIGSSVGGGTTNIVTGENATIGGGASNNATALNSNISGGDSNKANGNSSAVSGGRSNFAKSFGDWAGGINGTDYLAASTFIFIPTDRIFNVGNADLPSSPSDAFTILKNGLATLPNTTNLLIDASNNKAILTKEYTNANYSKINTNAPLAPGDFGIVGEIRVTPAYIYTCVETNTWVRTLVETW